MSGKRGDFGSRVMPELAGAIAAFATRKAIVLAWKRITGKEPPAHPEDRQQVALGEALVWALVAGAAMRTARVLATRATSRQQPAEPDSSAESPAEQRRR
ncbi:MAG TPA: DUF4235 domain-containing protein [Streptosporangiaceae bacterium]|nr:DUF4235 domain-containing protein [Streptosporangiaceae bacterium]